MLETLWVKNLFVANFILKYFEKKERGGGELDSVKMAKQAAVMTLGTNQNANFNDKVAYKMWGCYKMMDTTYCGVFVWTIGTLCGTK